MTTNARVPPRTSQSQTHQHPSMGVVRGLGLVVDHPCAGEAPSPGGKPHPRRHPIVELGPGSHIGSSTRHSIGGRQVQIEDCIVLLGQATGQAQVWDAQRLCGDGTQGACKTQERCQGTVVDRQCLSDIG